LSSTPLDTALSALAAAARTPLREGASASSWRWSVRQQVTAVRAELVQQSGSSGGAWIDARGGDAFAERNELLARLAELGRSVLEDADVDEVRADVGHVVNDVARHVQRP
jgi:hypothetical protein